MEKPSSFLFIGLRMVSIARKQNREARKRDPSGPEGVAMVLGREKATALEARISEAETSVSSSGK